MASDVKRMERVVVTKQDTIEMMKVVVDDADVWNMYWFLKVEVCDDRHWNEYYDWLVRILKDQSWW